MSYLAFDKKNWSYETENQTYIKQRGCVGSPPPHDIGYGNFAFITFGFGHILRIGASRINDAAFSLQKLPSHLFPCTLQKIFPHRSSKKIKQPAMDRLLMLNNPRKYY